MIKYWTEKEYAIKPVGLTGGKGVKVMGDQLPDRKEGEKHRNIQCNTKVLQIFQRKERGISEAYKRASILAEIVIGQ